MVDKRPSPDEGIDDDVDRSVSNHQTKKLFCIVTTFKKKGVNGALIKMKNPIAGAKHK